MRVVFDANVLVAAMLSGGGAARQVLRLCLTGQVTPLIGAALFAEVQDVLSRDPLFARSALSGAERAELFDAVMHVSVWTDIHFLWRPNLPDEADNHVVELALAGAASWIVTTNLRDFTQGELQLSGLRIAPPATFLQAWENPR